VRDIAKGTLAKLVRLIRFYEALSQVRLLEFAHGSVTDVQNFDSLVALDDTENHAIDMRLASIEQMTEARVFGSNGTAVRKLLKT
jgi:hypothetical protein